MSTTSSSTVPMSPPGDPSKEPTEGGPSNVTQTNAAPGDDIPSSGNGSITSDVRSRNVKGLELLLVLRNKDRVTKEILNQVIDDASHDALQKVKVAEGEEAEILKKTYGLLLSISPFGDYETWIREADFASYLRNYPGYELPISENKVKEAFQNSLKEKQPANINSEALAEQSEAWDKARESFPTDNPSEPPSAAIGVVSTATVIAASVRGARTKVSTQQTQMGGSATDAALALGWIKDDEKDKRVEMAKDSDSIVWDSPDVYPFEWLHRIASSWGSPGANELTSASTNFIFGSSESNSLMTRFENSWQRLFLQERSYQNEAKKSSEKPDDHKIPEFKGFLITRNTDPKIDIIYYFVDTADGAKVKSIRWRKSGGKVTKDGTESDIDYWGWISDPSLTNFSFSLDYRLRVINPSSVLGACGDLHTTFFPLQRGFFTRIESEIDFRLMDKWTEKAKESIPSSQVPGGAGGHNVPSVSMATDEQTPRAKHLKINKTGTLMAGNAFTTSSPIIVSPLTPAQLPQAQVWRTAIKGQAIEVGGTQVNDLRAVIADHIGQTMKVPLSQENLSDAATSGKIEVLVIDKALALGKQPVQADGNTTITKVVAAPPELQATSDQPSLVPAQFVLSGTIKLFGKFDEDLYSYHGDPSLGLQQIISLKTGTLKLSDYIPYLAGSELESIQLQDAQLIYNQYTTATSQAGTWLQTDVLLSGALQPVGDVLKTIFQQPEAHIRLGAMLSIRNDWTEPPSPPSFGLRGSIPGMSVKFGDLIEFTDLGISLSIGRHRETWPPYQEKVDWGVGFFGSLNLETPNEAAPLVMNFNLSENDGFMTLIIDLEETSRNFFGVFGLQLSDVLFTTSFAAGSSPTSLAMTATASLQLKDTSIALAGHYTKDDWGFFSQLQDFDFASLRDLYGDLFDSPLHLSDHEIVVEDLALVADSAGILVSGKVTIEGHSCAQASISLSRLGVEINGKVDDIVLAKNVVLREAALDVFIGPTSDTEVEGPGTSSKFAINGTVSLGSNSVSASLFLGKDATGAVVWTVFGSFNGAFSLSKIAPELQGTFLDLNLQQACLIASNADGSSAAGPLIPPQFPVLKGVQIAASLETIPALDHTMNNQGAPTSGLTLQAMYKEDTSVFDIAIALAAPQTVAMKNSSIFSGPISLVIEVSATPNLMILADFFVSVPDQNSPLKFTGGIKANIDSAKAFIELKDQWWTNPFGLSSQLKLGPDLALQLGIIYAGPVYPSEVGVAAGLMIGDVSGAAALSISESPADELIMVKVVDLGIQDLMKFASTIFEHDLPQLDDFLHFKEVSLYMSTGATIGTTVYPPGASFSCDAVIFGKEAKVDCAVNKATESIIVKGSLDPIDIGPVFISGSQPGTPAELEVNIDTTIQNILINGRIQIGDLDASVYLKANFLPTITFDLKSELDFSTHLKFTLDATMRSGSFQGLASLQSLDFDIYVLLQQDILDYVTAQVNLQCLSAKKAVDDGISDAQATLDKAQQEYNAEVKVAQDKLNAAKTVNDLKIAQVQGAFQAEQAASNLKIQALQGDVDRAFQAFQGVVGNAKDNLGTATENSTNAIRNAQQNLTNAQNTANSGIDSALSNLTRAQNDLQNRFGNALSNLQNAQNNVNSAQNVVNSAQRDYDNANNDMNNERNPFKKAAKAIALGPLGARLAATKGSLATATGVLSAAQAIVSGPGYSAANASVNFYQNGLTTARQAADAALSTANAGLQTTISVQTNLVNQAATALNIAETASQELQASNIAKKALADYQSASAAVLNGLSTAVSGLATCAEKVAFDAATTGLALAQANVADIDIAKSALTHAEEDTDSVIEVGDWFVSHTVDILNIQKMELTGDLRGLMKEGTKLKIRLVGSFADEDVDFNVDYEVGRGEEMVKEVFGTLMGNVKAGLLKVGK